MNRIVILFTLVLGMLLMLGGCLPAKAPRMADSPDEFANCCRAHDGTKSIDTDWNGDNMAHCIDGESDRSFACIREIKITPHKVDDD